MAIKLTTQIYNVDDGYLTRADGIKGTYVVVDKISWEDGDPEWDVDSGLCYRDDSDEAFGIPIDTLMDGSLCYVNSEEKFYTWNGNSWEEGIRGVQEDKLVTSISEDSTDEEYPSAKCVYDMIGNLESTLGGI